MARLKKLVLVTAEHHPYHKLFMQLLDELARELGVEKEVKIEDYVYAIEHGKTDELGMAALPQLFAEDDEGKVHLLLAEMVHDANWRPDLAAAKKQVLERLKQLGLI